ncbi:unannotated protein [freshwater metagenome]|uniref:Unannotated protein n=1 Tax=freshwater metagenome TaxID=449393 RepID=A0A6J6GRE6_9ZZZZ
MHVGAIVGTHRQHAIVEREHRPTATHRRQPPRRAGERRADAELVVAEGCRSGGPPVVAGQREVVALAVLEQFQHSAAVDRIRGVGRHVDGEAQPFLQPAEVHEPLADLLHGLGQRVPHHLHRVVTQLEAESLQLVDELVLRERSRAEQLVDGGSDGVATGDAGHRSSVSSDPLGRHVRRHAQVIDSGTAPMRSPSSATVRPECGTSRSHVHARLGPTFTHVSVPRSRRSRSQIHARRGCCVSVGTRACGAPPVPRRSTVRPPADRQSGGRSIVNVAPPPGVSVTVTVPPWRSTT